MVAMLHKRTTLTARDIMTPPLTLLPDEISVDSAARLLAMNGAASAPVVDSQGRLVGVLSATDCIRGRHAKSESEAYAAADECLCQPWMIPSEHAPCVCKVRDVMCKNRLAMATPADSLGDVAETMIRMQVQKVHVVDSELRPVGTVTSLDILAAMREASTPGEATRLTSPG